MYLARNERLKLTANWLNTIAAGTVIAGAVTPLVALAYGLKNEIQNLSLTVILILPAIWILGGITLHLIGRSILGRLQE